MIGVDPITIRAALEAHEWVARAALIVDIENVATADEAIASVLDDLGDLALAAWPEWSATSDAISAVWRRAASRLAATGKRPRFRRAPSAVELRQLLLTLDPTGLTLITSVNLVRPIASSATIAAIEWCARHGAAVVVSLPAEPPSTPPFDRILYGAIDIVRPRPTEPSPAMSRLITPPGSTHHASPTEARIRSAILADPELAPLFGYNLPVRTNALGMPARVDLLWEAGRVVVELDGPEHCGEPNYGADRHRDYELTVAGYLVLRITNAQIATDLQHSLEKIRAVVRYRRSEGRFRA